MNTENLDSTRPPLWRTVVLVLFSLFCTFFSMAVSPWGHRVGNDDSDAAFWVILTSILVGWTLTIALGWRHRWPERLALMTSLVAVVLPLGNTLAYICLASLIGRRRGPGVAVAGAVVTAATSIVVLKDALAQPRGASFVKFLTSPTADHSLPGDPNWTVVVIFAALGLGLSIGSGFLMRSRRVARLAEETVRAERRTSTTLGDEVARREERERIAREVHDSLGHRLSLLGLHAGAMEANTEDDRLRRSAALVRDNAEEAMEDLRSLLGVLRSPMAEHPELPLTLLPKVVEESFGAGQQLSSSIFIQDAESADPTLSRAVYRIVQEVLTNARKHAPGARVTMSVTGGPSSGILIESRNPLLQSPTGAAPGSRRGLAGIAERAELLGGSLRHGLDEGGRIFRVQVQLPWLSSNGTAR